MALFHYDAPDSRFGATIAEMMQHQGDQQARSAELIGQLQAQNAGQSSRIWGNAVQGIGATIGQALDPTRRRELALKERTQGLQEQRLGMENRALESQLGDKEHQRQARTAISAASAKTPRNPDGTFNIEGILANTPEEYQADAEPHLSVYDSYNKSVLGARKQKSDEAAQFAGKIAGSGAWQDGPTMDAFIATVEDNHIITSDQAKAAREAVAADPTYAKTFLGRFVTPGKIEDVAPGHKLVQDGKVTFENPLAPEKPTDASLALDAARGNPDAAAALDRLKPPPAPQRETRSLDVQAAEALQKGDQETYKRLMKVKRDMGLADNKPDAPKEPVDILPDVQTTISGKKYVDGSAYVGNERNRARDAAGKAGITVVSKEQANALQEIDNARANQRDIMAQIESKLPTGTLARGGAAISVPLAKFFQTDDQKAAFGSWRTAAINTLRATAGSKGLRINQAEIAQAIENDIPKLTDTIGVARQKVANINKMLDNAESSIVVRDRSTPVAAPVKPSRTSVDDELDALEKQ